MHNVASDKFKLKKKKIIYLQVHYIYQKQI